MIEKTISQYIERQFPAFYKEEGQNFIAFMKAYYEWLELPENTAYKSRHLLEWRDVDTTLDEFIVYFKEKYLKNIQFNVSSNKKLLIKNASDLYRSKGTERSIDLFFKLVYGVDAEVQYPAERIFKLSDGQWETPRYLEITYNKQNINYVGKQIIGSLSGATAFVEKYIRRRAGFGIVSILYISNPSKEFIKGESVGISQNGSGIYTDNSARIIGSISSVTILDNGREFAVGDIVNFQDSERGRGGSARVVSVSEETGVVDFILEDGLWGYSTNAVSLVSEKVLLANNIYNDKFVIMDTVVQPSVFIEYQNSATISVGDIVRKYDGSNVVANGTVIDVDHVLSSNSGTATISITSGPFTIGDYKLNANISNINVTSISDFTTYAEVMGVPTTFLLTVSNANSFVNGQIVTSNNNSRGTVSQILDNTITVVNTIGHFVNGNSLNDTTITNVEASVGVYNINKRSFRIDLADANTPPQWLISPYVYKYDANDDISASGLVVRSNVSSNTAILNIIPLKGFFESGDFVYTSGNTSIATVGSYTGNTRGGDFVETAGAKYRGIFSNVNFTVTSFSDGFGAGFNVGTIGETETLYINNDFINANSKTSIDITARVVTVASNTGFKVGQAVSQDRSGNFDPSTDLNTTTGVFTTATLLPWATNNSLVVYDPGSSNTINGMVANGYYRVTNTSGNSFNLIAVHDNKLVNNTNIPNFGNNVHANTQLIRKTTIATIRGISGTNITVGDVWQGPFITSANLYISTTPTTNTNVSAVGSLTYPTVNSYNYRYKRLRSVGLGFAKSPTGYYNSILNNLLTFQLLTVGRVASLTSVFGGSGYNVDPYVLIQEPAISGFNRKDYIIKISNVNSVFLPGEKVSQNLPNTNIYTYQVNNGVFDTTPSTKSFNSFLDVSDTDNVIYALANVFSFNSTLDLIANNGFIKLPNTESFAAGDKVKYVTATGNTAVTTNNTILNVSFVNSTGISVGNSTGNVVLAETVKLIVPANIANNYIAVPTNPFANDDIVRYVADVGNTAILGLANNNLYYVIDSNSSHLRLSNSLGGSALTLATGGNETGHGLIKYNASANGNYLRLYKNDLQNGMLLQYIVSSGNTAVTNLTNENNYFVVNSNTYFYKLSSTLNGSSIDIANNGTFASDGHALLFIPGFSVNDPVYSSNNGGSGIIRGVYKQSGNSFIVVRNVSGTISNGDTIVLNNNPVVNSTILSVDLEQEIVTAEGIVQTANSTTIVVRRIQFENLWQVGISIKGETSGANANVVSIVEDIDSFPIGLNADIQANVITAEGQVTNLQIVDSGYGYTNNEVIQFVSVDGQRAGTVKVVLGGTGIGSGYYKTSKGFLSDVICLHDGDYYQEYSYEVFSKLSVDRYADMFKKVMHTAGTKFFGSVMLINEANATLSLTESSVTGNVAG